VVSESDLLDEADVLADVSGREQTAGDLGRSYNQQFVGGVLQQRIVVLLVEGLLADEGQEVTAEERAQARQELESEPTFTELPGWYQDVSIEDSALFTKLAQIFPEDGGLGAVMERAERADVEISSHYGSWDPSLLAEYYQSQAQAPPAVVPPEGPRAASTSE
jgi:hypothetical protein